MNNNTPIRTRFAPSPTGFLHVGGARTALFNYLFARHGNGLFLLRIEDTDRERSLPEHTQSILNSLHWLGLEWDGEPVYQSVRMQEHRKLCSDLFEQGAAYPCFCTHDSLREKREAAVKAGLDTRYDRTCLSIAQSEARSRMQRESFVLRFRIPEGETVFDDRVHGRISVRHQEIDDFVIQRSDGSPVYQIAVVADDHDMEITHVIRGDDHLTNTVKQILIYRAMQWSLPEFAHVPLILGEDKKRLSKRHGATSVEAYREQGILPEAMVNFLALLGWSPGDDLERMNLAELTGAFTLDRISGKPAVFDLKKLEWMNAAVLSELPESALIERLQPALSVLHESADEDVPEERLLRMIALLKPRLKNLNDFQSQAACFFRDPESFEPKAREKYWSDEEVPGRLETLLRRLDSLEDWNETALEEALRSEAEKMGIGAGKLIHPVRLALTGSGSSPGLFEVMSLLGKETVIRRIKKGIDTLANP